MECTLGPNLLTYLDVASSEVKTSLDCLLMSQQMNVKGLLFLQMLLSS